MKFNFPKNTSQYFWTEHAKFKMGYYGLSAQKVLGVIRRPKRKEEGIVKNTIAVMQPVSPKKINNKEIWKQEIWVMFQKVQISKLKVKSLGINKKQVHPVKYPAGAGSAFGGFNGVKIISAWRYPGVSPKKNPIPEEILEEIVGMANLSK